MNNPKIRPYDGYRGEPIFVPLKDSTYYEWEVDSQVRVPLRSREEIMKELETLRSKEIMKGME